MLFENYKQKMDKNENNLKKLQLELDQLDLEIEDYLSTLSITPQQLFCFLQNKDNFTPEEWELLEKEREKINDKLDKKLITDLPLRKERKENDQFVRQHWIHVR